MENNAASRNIVWSHWVQCMKKELEPRFEATFALSNGYLGLNGASEEMLSWSKPEFFVSGTYAKGPVELLGYHDPDHILTHPRRIPTNLLEIKNEPCIPTLPNLPNPIGIKLSVGERDISFEEAKILSNERLIEIDKGILKRTMVFRETNQKRTRVDAQRFVSFACPNLICIQYRITPLDHEEKIHAEGFINKLVSNQNCCCLWEECENIEDENLKAVLVRPKRTEINISIAQRGKLKHGEKNTTLEVFIIAGELGLNEAIKTAELFAEKGFDQCLYEHIESYKKELDGAYVEIDGNMDLVQGFNFGQMHLQMAFPYGNNRVGIPIKGLTGSGYRFCNFWDMDFHMFPYYLMTKPRQAHLLLEYRYNQLSKYRENARKWGARGAQVPWETQLEGDEATAPWLCLQEREIHISADAAYMFKLYDDLTPNHDVLIDMGAEFILETARFYASRIRWNERNQRFELPDIGCPDQYHTFADNNFFTGIMVRWNLEYAIHLTEEKLYQGAVRKIALSSEEISQWKEILQNFYIIQPNREGIIEQFDGYFELSPNLEGICETYCAHSQAVKQPDVLAAIVPFEDYFPKEIWIKNYNFYTPRTFHGSSLSLPGTAYAAARCGLLKEAVYYLHRSSRMDLDNVNLDTEKGIHVSGGAVEWQTIVFGFGGVKPTPEGLYLSPNLPEQWEYITATVHWKFQRITFTLTKTEVALHADSSNIQSIPIKLKDLDWIQIGSGDKKQIPY